MVGPPSSWSLRDQEDELFGLRIVRTLVPSGISTDHILRSIAGADIRLGASCGFFVQSASLLLPSCRQSCRSSRHATHAAAQRLALEALAAFRSSHSGRRRARRWCEGVSRVSVPRTHLTGARAGPACSGEGHQDPRFLPAQLQSERPAGLPPKQYVVLVDTDAGITGIGQGGSPDTVRNVARSVIGKNAFDTEMIWQAAFMDGFYSPGKERLHALCP